MRKRTKCLGLLVLCLGLLCCGEGSDSVSRRVLQDPNTKKVVLVITRTTLQDPGSRTTGS